MVQARTAQQNQPAPRSLLPGRAAREEWAHGVCGAQHQNQAQCSQPAQSAGDCTTLAWLVFLVPPPHSGADWSCCLQCSTAGRISSGSGCAGSREPGQCVPGDQGTGSLTQTGGFPWILTHSTSPPGKLRVCFARTGERGLKSIHGSVLSTSEGKVL